MPNAALTIVVQHHALDQCEVLVNKYRVAYICYGGPEKKLNWLPKETSGLELTVEEKIEVASEVRRQMAKLTADHEAQQEGLEARLQGFEPEPVAATRATSPASVPAKASTAPSDTKAE